MAMFFGGKKVDDPKFEFFALNFLTDNHPQPSNFSTLGILSRSRRRPKDGYLAGNNFRLPSVLRGKKNPNEETIEHRQIQMNGLVTRNA